MCTHTNYLAHLLFTRCFFVDSVDTSALVNAGPVHFTPNPTYLLRSLMTLLPFDSVHP